MFSPSSNIEGIFYISGNSDIDIWDGCSFIFLRFMTFLSVWFCYSWYCPNELFRVSIPCYWSFATLWLINFYFSTFFSGGLLFSDFSPYVLKILSMSNENSKFGFLYLLSYLLIFNFVEKFDFRCAFVTWILCGTNIVFI